MISGITYESKEQALDKFKKSLGNNEYLLSSYTVENSPIPASFNVSLKDTAQIKEVSEYCKTLNGVKDAVYGQDTVENLFNFSKMTTRASWIGFAIFSLVAIFIIYNTIKLTVFSRRTEISIMKYLGATNTYIQLPFIIEGIMLGFTGSVISVLIIRNLYYFIFGVVQSSMSILPVGGTLASPEYVISRVCIYFIGYGILIGAIGSTFSLKKFLKV